MPSIKTYDAPIQKITPDERGFTASENMARRLGPLFNEAARAYEQIGRLTADEIKQRSWPFNILKLQQAANASGGGFRVHGLGSSGRSGGGGRTSSPGRQAYRSLGEVSHGAGALGRAMSAAPDPDQAYLDRLNKQAELTGQLVGTDYGPGGSFDRILRPGETLADNGDIIGDNSASDQAAYNKTVDINDRYTSAYNARSTNDFNTQQQAQSDYATAAGLIAGQGGDASALAPYYQGNPAYSSAIPPDQTGGVSTDPTSSYGAAASYLGGLFSSDNGGNSDSGGGSDIGGGDQGIGAGSQDFGGGSGY